MRPTKPRMLSNLYFSMLASLDTDALNALC
jgi:hypothetical protein